MPTRTRLLLFGAVFLAVAAWVAAHDGEHAHTARHFLRALLRQLF